MAAETWRQDAVAALAWQRELGADECIGELGLNRFEEQSLPPAAAPPAAVVARKSDRTLGSDSVAASCGSLDELREAVGALRGIALRDAARNTVFSDGLRGAALMIVGEAPGREEDATGRPFVGRSGQLLDRMLAAIGLSREQTDPARAVYITNVIPWRPPANRDPAADEIAQLKPFLFRHIELAAPKALVLMGSTAGRVVLDTKVGIMRLRGQWTEWRGVPVLPMLHPAAILREPSRKKLAWSDLLSLQARLQGHRDEQD